MRLRPSGNSGMLVSSMKAFEKYQRQDAWTWEHQALARARVVAGDESLASRFDAVRERILGLPRDPDKLLSEVRGMREKMHLGAADKLKSPALAEQNIKQGYGGLIDIEFITQYLVLRYTHENPVLCRWTDNVRMLEDLGETLALKIDYMGLIEAYRVLRSALHKKSLSGVSYPEGLNSFPDQRALVRACFSSVFDE